MRAQTLTSETILDLGTSERSFPKFNIGDTIEVSIFVKEGDKERVQIFKGDVIAKHNKGASSTFIVRKMGAHSVPVERIFPYYSPIIKDIKVVRTGKARRAKAYYVRDRLGKSARFKEKLVTKKQREEAAGSRKRMKNEAQVNEKPAVQEGAEKAE